MAALEQKLNWHMCGEDILEIPSLEEVMRIGVITEQEMYDVRLRKQSFDFTVYHAGDSQPTTWTLTTSEDFSSEARFTGLTSFIQKNAADMRPGRTFLISRLSCAERTLAVLVARDNVHLNQIRANSLAHLEIIWQKQARRTFTREMEEADMNSDMLLIRSLCEMMSKAVLTPQEVQDVSVGRESLDFRVIHAKDAQPMTWTLTPDDESRDGGLFSGWREFREKNEIRKDCTLVLIRHPDDPQRTLTVVGAQASAHCPDPASYLNSVLDYPEAEIELVRYLQMLLPEL